MASKAENSEQAENPEQTDVVYCQITHDYIKKNYDSEKKSIIFVQKNLGNEVTQRQIYEDLKDKDIESFTIKDSIIDSYLYYLILLFEESNITKFTYDSVLYRSQYLVSEILKSNHKFSHIDIYVSIYNENDITNIFNVLELNKTIKNVFLDFSLGNDELDVSIYKKSIKNMFKNNKVIESFGFSISVQDQVGPCGIPGPGPYFDYITYKFIVEYIIKYARYNDTITELKVHPYYFLKEWDEDPDQQLIDITFSLSNIVETLRQNTTLQVLDIIILSFDSKNILDILIEALTNNTTIKDIVIESSASKNITHLSFPEKLAIIEEKLEQNRSPKLKSVSKQ